MSAVVQPPDGAAAAPDEVPDEVVSERTVDDTTEDGTTEDVTAAEDISAAEDGTAEDEAAGRGDPAWAVVQAASRSRPTHRSAAGPRRRDMGATIASFAERPTELSTIDDGRK